MNKYEAREIARAMIREVGRIIGIVPWALIYTGIRLLCDMEYNPLIQLPLLAFQLIGLFVFVIT